MLNEAFGTIYSNPQGQKTYLTFISLRNLGPSKTGLKTGFAPLETFAKPFTELGLFLPSGPLTVDPLLFPCSYPQGFPKQVLKQVSFYLPLS